MMQGGASYTGLDVAPASVDAESRGDAAADVRYSKASGVAVREREADPADDGDDAVQRRFNVSDHGSDIQSSRPGDRLKRGRQKRGTKRRKTKRWTRRSARKRRYSDARSQYHKEARGRIWVASTPSLMDGRIESGFWPGLQRT